MGGTSEFGSVQGSGLVVGMRDGVLYGSGLAHSREDRDSSKFP